MIVPESVRKDWVVPVDTTFIEIKTQLDEARADLQSEKEKVATMELLVASLVKRVGDLENLVI